VLKDSFAESERIQSDVETTFDALHIEIQTADSRVIANIDLIDGV